jgi:uncharacterized protein (DUF2062 family)
MADPVDTSTRVQSGPLPEQWPAQATETIVRVVGQVRDRTTGPAITVARATVYGLFAAILGLMALVLAVVLAIRVANNYLPGQIWIIYVALGGLFSLGGLFLWGKAFSSPPDKS